jgi:hypothetical protein
MSAGFTQDAAASAGSASFEGGEGRSQDLNNGGDGGGVALSGGKKHCARCSKKNLVRTDFFFDARRPRRQGRATASLRATTEAASTSKEEMRRVAWAATS